jgi:hypothetical protein
VSMVERVEFGNNEYSFVVHNNAHAL